MVNLATSHFSPAIAPIKRDPLIELNRLLARLDQNILHATAEQERRLRRDEFERTRTRASVDAGRSLLTHLEKYALSVKVPARRQALQADLVRKREVLQLCGERLSDLEELGAQVGARGWGRIDEDDGDDESDEEEEEEDILSDVIPTPSESMGSRSTGLLADEDEDGADAWTGEGRESQMSTDTSEEKEQRPQADVGPSRANHITAQSTQQQQQPESQTTTTSQNLRSRTKQPPTSSAPDHPELPTAKSTSTSLFNIHPDRDNNNSINSSHNATATEEALLDNHRKEQEALSEDILRLAQALKEKSLATSQLLEDDASVLGRVGDGLHATDTSIESAGKRMGLLSRMTEGKGFVGRLIMYGVVYGLMVVLVLVFAFVPKLRL